MNNNTLFEGWCDFCLNPPFTLVNKATGLLVKPQCNRPKVCRRAANYYRWCIRERLQDIAWTAALTLTMTKAFGQPSQANITVQSRAWSRFISRVRQIHGPFHWAWLREQSPLHLHVLWDALSIPQADLSSIAEQSGFGPVVHIRATRTPGERCKAIDYVTKSLSLLPTDPNGDWPLRTRRYRASVPKQAPQPKQQWGVIYDPAYSLDK